MVSKSALSLRAANNRCRAVDLGLKVRTFFLSQQGLPQLMAPWVCLKTLQRLRTCCMGRN